MVYGTAKAYLSLCRVSADETNTQAYIRHRYAVSVNDHMKIDKKSFDSDRSPEFH